MPKPRAKLSPIEQAIIERGGEPGTSADVEPIRPEPVKPAAPPVKPAAPPGKGVYRPTMTRFPPDEFAIVEQAVKDYVKTHKMKISLNSWIIAACLEKVERDKPEGR